MAANSLAIDFAWLAETKSQQIYRKSILHYVWPGAWPDNKIHIDIHCAIYIAGLESVPARTFCDI